MKDIIHHTYVCSYCDREFADFKDCLDHEDSEHFDEKFKDRIACESYFGRYFTYNDNGPCNVRIYKPYDFTHSDNDELCLKCIAYSYTYDEYDDYPTEPYMDIDFHRDIRLSTIKDDMKEISEDEFKEFIMMALDNNTDCLEYFE